MKIKAGKIIQAAMETSENSGHALVGIQNNRDQANDQRKSWFWISGLAAALLVSIGLIAISYFAKPTAPLSSIEVTKLNNLGIGEQPTSSNRKFVNAVPGEDIKISIESDSPSYFYVIRVRNGSAELFANTVEPALTFESPLISISRTDDTWWLITSPVDQFENTRKNLHCFESITFGEPATAVLSRELDRKGFKHFSLDWLRYEFQK